MCNLLDTIFRLWSDLYFPQNSTSAEVILVKTLLYSLTLLEIRLDALKLRFKDTKSFQSFTNLILLGNVRFSPHSNSRCCVDVVHVMRCF